MWINNKLIYLKEKYIEFNTIILYILTCQKPSAGNVSKSAKT